MPREISDEEYQFLQGRRQVADFVEPIYNHPQWGKEAKRLIKQVYPQVKIPDYDIEEQVNARFDAEKKQRDEATAAERQRAQDDHWRKERTRVQRDYGFTEEGMQELEAFMKEKFIGDYEVAASYRASKNPKPVEASWDETRWHHERAPGFDQIAKDPEAWGRTEILSAIRRGQERVRAG